MASGTVKWFSPTIGFGYIRPDDGSRDLLVTGASVMQAGFSTLDVDQQLHFEVRGTSERQSAVNLQNLFLI